MAVWHSRRVDIGGDEDNQPLPCLVIEYEEYLTKRPRPIRL
jgi:hypothetical protein